MSPCRACGSSNAPLKIWDLPEMMRGSGERFAYAECADCGSLWLMDPPADLGPYYGASYYSFGATWRTAPAWRRWMKRSRDAWQLWRRPFWGALLAARSRYPELDSIRRAGLKRTDRVLDVGCGDGLFVSSLAALGMDATGIDPFLPADETLASGARLLRRKVVDMQGSFDFVTMNHSLEHVEDPAAALSAVHALTAPGGRCLIRVPTCSSKAWRQFREHWIQLDPPRHLVLFSRGALSALAVSQGWTVKDSFDDSGGFQFWGSLQAQQGLATAEGPRFNAAELRGFEAEAAELNKAGDGDSLALLLLKG